MNVVLTREQIFETAASIAAVQESDGAIPWTTGEHTDAWNHVEGAMALVVGGQLDAAAAAYDWCARTQRPDGSWPMKVVRGQVEDASTESNMAAYIAVGVLHHWAIRRDRAFLERMWPVVRRSLDLVVDLQLPFGGIAWSREWSGSGGGAGPWAAEDSGGGAGPWAADGAGGGAGPWAADGAGGGAGPWAADDSGGGAGPWAAEDTVNREALLAGSSSIYQALRCGVALAELMGEPQPEWELAGGRLGHALREHRDQFLDKSVYSMDWYYPVLGGAVRGPAAEAMIASQWSTFVVDGVGVRCVSTNPWFTGAETCELVMALAAIGDDRASELFADMQHLRADRDGYWTGLVLPENVRWPVEQTTYTAAAVILAWDVLTGTTPGAGVMTGHEIGVEFGDIRGEIALECDCPSSDRFAGVAPGAR